MTTVSLVLWPYAGTSGLTLFLYKETTPATVANTGGDTLTAGSEGTFTATVGETLSGMYNVVVKQGSTVVAAGGKVYFDGSSTVYVDAAPPEIYPPVERDVSDTRAIEFYWKAIGATFANSASTCKRRFAGETGAQEEALSGAITAVSGVSGLYKLAYSLADRAADATTIIPTEVTYRLVDDNGNSGDLTLRITEATGGATTGTGSNQLAVTITDGTSAIAGAIVSAKQGGIVKAWGYSNGAGLVAFSLASGTYSIEVQNQPGFAPQSPTSVTVPASSTLTIALTAQTISPPTTPGLCTVRFAVLDNGTAVQGAIVQVELEDINPTVNTALVSRVIHSGTTNSSGYVDLVMIQKGSFTRGGFYRIRVSDAGGRRLHDRRVYVPTSSTMFAEDLPDAEDFPT